MLVNNSNPKHFFKKIKRREKQIAPLFSIKKTLAAIALATMASQSAFALCTQVGNTITCSGPSAGVINGTDNVNMIVEPGAVVQDLLGILTPTVLLTGNNINLANLGTIDPSILGLLTLRSGTVLGNPNPNNISVYNNGNLFGTYGLLGLSLLDLTGLALTTQNGLSLDPTRVINIFNDTNGFIGGTPLLGATLLEAPNAPEIAAYGGSQVNFTNLGQILGRTAFQASLLGNHFLNAGTITGSVSLGSNGGPNEFIAVTGSSVVPGAGATLLPLLPVLGLDLFFAASGTVDGGGANSSLILQNNLSGIGNGFDGNGIIPAGTYVNFGHLILKSGSWILQGANSFLDASLLGGAAIVENNLSLGVGVVTSNGGLLIPGVNNLNLPNPFNLAPAGLTVSVDPSLASLLTLSGPIFGPGALNKAGAGTLQLTNATDFAGGTNVFGGTLATALSGALPLNGALNLLGAGATFDISGALVPQQIGQLSGVPGSLINLGTNFLTLNPQLDSLFEGSIFGTGGIIKNGPGTLILTGNNPYTGLTEINAGALQVDGSIGGSALVNPFGILQGNGVIGGNGSVLGTIAPGVPGALGMLNFLGNYVQVPNSTYDLTLGASAGIADLVNILGSAFLSGGIVNVHPNLGSNTFALGRYLILQASGGVFGQFSGTTPSPLLLALNLVYDPTHVFLDVSRNSTSIGSFGGNGNQVSVGRALDFLSPNDPLFNALVNLDSVQAIQQALTALSGEAYASLLGSFAEGSHFVENSILNRLLTPNALMNEKDRPHSAYNIWGEGVGYWSERDGSYKNARVRDDTGGFFVGADVDFAASRFGILGGYSSLKSRVRQLRDTRIDVDTYYLGLYGSADTGSLVFRLGGAYGWHNIDSSRHVFFPGVDEHLRADFNGRTAIAFLDVGYPFRGNWWQPEPFARVTGVDTGTSPFREGGGITALRAVDENDQDLAFTTVGVRAKPVLTQNDRFVVKGRGMLGWTHAYGRVASLGTFLVGSSAPFTVEGNPIARDSLAINAGLDVLMPNNNLTLSLSYFGQIANRVQDNGVYGIASWRFG